MRLDPWLDAPSKCPEADVSTPPMKPAMQPISGPASSPCDPAEERRHLDRARGGDRDAFDLLALDAMPALLGSARRLLGDEHAAEAAVAEALFHAFRRLDSFEGRSRFSTWVHRILYRAIADEIRGRVRERRRRLRLLDKPPGAPAATPGDRLAAEEMRVRLREATDDLPPKQRLVLLLVVWEGLSLRETARLLAMRYRTAKSNLHHARRAVARAVGEEEPS